MSVPISEAQMLERKCPREMPQQNCFIALDSHLLNFTNRSPPTCDQFASDVRQNAHANVVKRFGNRDQMEQVQRRPQLLSITCFAFFYNSRRIVASSSTSARCSLVLLL